MGVALGIRTDLASPARLRRQARRERNPRAATWMLAVANAMEGMGRAEAARLAGMERQALRDAVVRFNAAGTVRLDRPQVRQAAAPGQPVARRAPARPVAAEDAAAAPASRRAGQGGLRQRGLSRAAAVAAETHPGKRVEVWFMDEARVGENGRTGHRWWVRGERPRGLRQIGYEWAFLFGAVRPATGQGFALVLPEVSTAAMQAFLDRFAAALAAGAHALLVLDQAGWHGSRGLAVPANVTLVPLPPYAPELNPVERVWLFLRERFLSHRVLDGYDAIVAACCEAWNALSPERLCALCAHHWVRKVAS